MIVKVMRDFIRKPVSRYRLAEALDRACPDFVAWCDNPDHSLSRRDVIDQFEESWLSQLDLPLPAAAEPSLAGQISRVETAQSTIFRLGLVLRPLDSSAPGAALRLLVRCRGAGERVCTVTAAIADSGATKFAVFYRSTLTAELVGAVD